MRTARHPARRAKTGRGGFYGIAKVEPGSFILALDFAISALIEGRGKAAFAERGTSKLQSFPQTFPAITHLSVSRIDAFSTSHASLVSSYIGIE